MVQFTDIHLLSFDYKLNMDNHISSFGIQYSHGFIDINRSNYVYIMILTNLIIDAYKPKIYIFRFEY